MTALEKANQAENRNQHAQMEQINHEQENLVDKALRGRRRIMRMVNSLTAPQEIGAPMACMYLLNQTPFYYSHESVDLYFPQSLKLLLNEQVPITATLRSSEMQENEEDNSHEENNDQNDSTTTCKNPQLVDYVNRNESKLENFSYYEFVQTYEKKKSTEGFRFSENHVQYETHSLFKFTGTQPFVVVYGSRLPYILGASLSQDEHLLFYQMMLILFKPFRKLSDLIGSSDSTLQAWKNAYDLWEKPLIAELYLANNLDYYESKHSSDNEIDPAMQYFESLSNDYSFHDVPDFLEEQINNESSNNDQSDDDANMDYLESIFSENMRNSVSDIVDNLQNVMSYFTDKVQYKYSPHLFQDYKTLLENSSIDDILRSQVSLDNEFAMATPSSDFSLPKDIVIRQLDMAINSLDWDDSFESIPSNMKYPSLSMISKNFKLNFKQHKMFIYIGLKFLESIAADHDVNFQTSVDHSSFLIRDQLFAFLLGGAGYGKSEVIKALLFLAKSWGHEGSIITSSYTGIAAVNVWGQTLHSLFAWSITDILPTKKISFEMRNKFALLRILIIDEISMLAQEILGRLDESLRILKNNSSKLGGVHLLIVGDWLQQSPIYGAPLYKAPNEFDITPDKQDLFRLRYIGYNVYNGVNCVVRLDKNMRHSLNSSSSDWFPSLLERLRFGEITEEDLEKLNNTCFFSDLPSNNLSMHETSPFDHFCPFIVSSHAVRVQMNVEMMKSWAQKTSTPLYEYAANYSLPDGISLTPAQYRSMSLLWDNKTGNLPIKLRLGLGMPMMCTQNVAPHLKLCNGSIGHIVYIQQHPQNRETLISSNDIYLSQCSHQPLFILFKLWKIDFEFFPGLGPGVVPIRPYTINSLQIKLPKRERPFSIRIRQLPLVPAFSLLIEKVQGLTLDSVILGPLRHITRRAPQKTALHVATTRVRDPVNMRLLQPLTMDDILYFTPPLELINETKRLEDIEIQD
jgi:hypothetical protein